MTDNIQNLPLVLGQSTTARNPNTVALTKAVTIQNNSAYQLTIQIGSQSYSLPNYTQDLYTFGATGQPVVITPTNPNGADVTLPAFIVISWLGQDDAADGAYPAPLAPPAEALAASVAAQLLASGVPSVLVEDLIEPGVSIPGFNSGVQYDVSKYASIAITIGWPGSATAGAWIAIELADIGANAMTGELLYRPPTFGNTWIVDTSLAATIFISNNAFAFAVNVRIVASNRQVNRRIENRYNAAYPIGGIQVVPAVVGSTIFATNAQIQGYAFLYFSTNAAATKGYVSCQIDTGQTLILGDTGEALTLSSGGQYYTKMVILPAGLITLVFTVTAISVATSVRLTLTPAP